MCHRRLAGSSSIAATLLIAAGAQAQLNIAEPPETEGVGIDQKLNAPIPLNLKFRDETDNWVTLGDYFREGRPVIVTLNYYACPMLCGLQLNALLETLKEMEWTPGGQFEVVTISFDPSETPRLARLKKKSYMKEFGRPGAEAGWHFLTGPAESIRPLTEAVGFRYKWNEGQREWAHAAALILCTPDGRVSRYLPGVMYDARTLRLSLVEASQGKQGSLADQVFLTCFHYDAAAGGYTLMAVTLVRAGGVLGALALGVFLLVWWRRDAARRKAALSGT